MHEQDSKSQAEQQAELETIIFYIDSGEQRVQEIQSELDSGKITGQSVFHAQSVIVAYNKRLTELRIERQRIRWQTPQEASA